MISELHGTLMNSNDRSATLLVAGVGYELYMSPGFLLELLTQYGQEKVFYTYMHVREDRMELYGFPNTDDKKFFEMVLSVSGIGPRSALGILDVAPLGTLVSAIMQGDASYLTKVSGVGKKTAQKVVLELRDKVEKLGIKADASAMREDNDAVEALQALGYSLNQARDALKNIPEDMTEMNERIKFALKNLGS
jgi:Holliday junction DNA helicase RuvA